MKIYTLTVMGVLAAGSVYAAQPSVPVQLRAAELEQKAVETNKMIDEMRNYYFDRVVFGNALNVDDKKAVQRVVTENQYRFLTRKQAAGMCIDIREAISKNFLTKKNVSCRLQNGVLILD